MANEINWGDGVDNSIGWGQGSTNNDNDWGSIYDVSESGETLLEINETANFRADTTLYTSDNTRYKADQTLI
jgi:hypothetical protein